MTDISPLMIGSPETGLYKRHVRPLSHARPRKSEQRPALVIVTCAHH
jgi:hypothetical protein